MDNHRYPPARARRQLHVDRTGCGFVARGGRLTRLRTASAVITVLLACGAAAAQAGVVRVVSSSGAMVFVDGTFAGVTNEAHGGLVVLDVAPGERLVRVVADGDVVVETAIEVSPGAVTTVIAQRAAPPGAEPTGAEPTSAEPTSAEAAGAETGGAVRHERDRHRARRGRRRCRAHRRGGRVAR